MFNNNGETLIDFAEKGLKRISPSDIAGGSTIEESAKIFISVLENHASPEQHSVILANSALAINCIDPSKTIEDSVAIANESIVSGKALKTFNKLISIQK
jgi:anthranilate phosphoribosyltransferase